MMDDKVDEANNDFGDWIAELSTDADGEAGNSRMEETRFQSSASNPNTASRRTGNAAERLHQDTAAELVTLPGSSATSKPVDSNSDLTPKSTTEAVGRSFSLHNRPFNPSGTNIPSRRDKRPSFPANISEESSGIQTPKKSVSRPSRQLQLPQQNIQPSIHLFTGQNTRPSLIKQQPYIKTAQLQSSHQSTSARQMGNLGTASMSQHGQQLGLQRSVPEMQQQLPQFQNDVPNLLQRPLELQNTAFSLPMQQPQMMGHTPNYPNMQTHQYPSGANQRYEAMKSQHNLQKMSQPTQFPQHVDTQNQVTFIAECGQDSPQTSTSLHSQSSMVFNQTKQTEESQRVLPGSSSDSAAPSALTNSSDWRDQAYEQLQIVKEAHLADLIKIYKRAQDLSLQPGNADKYEKTRLFMEKVMMFLQIPKADFYQYSQEKVHEKMRMVTWYLRQLKDRMPLRQYQPLQISGSQLQMGQVRQRGGENLQANIPRQDMTRAPVTVSHLSTQIGPISSQPWQTNSSQQGSLSAMGRTESSLINLHLYGQLRSAAQGTPSRQQQHASMNIPTQCTPSRLQQTRVNIPPLIGSQRTFEQRVSSSFPHGSVISMFQNALNVPPQVNSSAREMVNALDSVMRSVPSSPAPSLSPLIMQQEKYQMMQAQKMKQPVQQAVSSQNDPRMLVQKPSEISNPNFGQVMSHQRMPQQHHLTGQPIEHSSHMWVPSSTSQHHAACPQVSQPPSPLVELMGFSSIGVSTPSHPTASPITIPSSPAPLSMSSALISSELNTSSHPLSLMESNKALSESFSSTTRVQSLSVDSHALPSSSLTTTATPPGSSEQSHAEGEDSHSLPSCSLPMTTTLPGSNEQSHAEGDSHGLPRSSLPMAITLPGNSKQSHAAEESYAEISGFDRLLEVVQSLSEEELHSSIEDIGMVVHLVDSTPGVSPYGGCREYTIDNSMYHWKYDEQEGFFFPHYGDPSLTKIKRHLSATASDGLTSPSCASDDLQCSSGLTSDKQSSPACTFKRQKTKLSDLLLHEVKEINHKLVETVVGMIHSPDPDKGTIMRLCYKAVGHSKHNNPSTLPDLVLQVLVTDDYPHSSPSVLDPSPDMFRDNEENKLLWENTRSKFDLSLRLCSKPVSLGKMARTWDSSARKAILELAKKQGGGCFTSTYGGWENITSA